jgi:hypothetical protein
LYKFILVILLSLLISSYSFSKSVQTKETKQKIKEAKEVISKLLPFQKSNSKDKLKFKIDKCKIDNTKWIMMLIAKTPFTESVHFAKDCDIEGTYTAKREVPFPVKFSLKNLKNFKQANFNLLVSVIYDPVPMIKLQMKNGTIKGKDNNIKFDVSYSAEIDPLSKDFIKKDNGGTLRIKTINGMKINQKYPLKIK